MSDTQSRIFFWVDSFVAAEQFVYLFGVGNEKCFFFFFFAGEKCFFMHRNLVFLTWARVQRKTSSVILPCHCF